MHRLQAQGREATNAIDRDRRWFYFLIGLGIAALDQASKLVVVRMLPAGEVVRLFDGDFIWLVLVTNRGLAFGIKVMPPIVLAVVAFLASVGLAIYLLSAPKLPVKHGLPLALIMGGALGNLVDRVACGRVIDFISVDMPNFIMDRWPVFNVADSAVSVGVCIMIVMMLFSRPTQTNREAGGGGSR